jgi:hypothetical protein
MITSKFSLAGLATEPILLLRQSIYSAKEFKTEKAIIMFAQKSKLKGSLKWITTPDFKELEKEEHGMRGLGSLWEEGNLERRGEVLNSRYTLQPAGVTTEKRLQASSEKDT